MESEEKRRHEALQTGISILYFILSHAYEEYKSSRCCVIKPKEYPNCVQSNEGESFESWLNNHLKIVSALYAANGNDVQDGDPLLYDDAQE